MAAGRRIALQLGDDDRGLTVTGAALRRKRAAVSFC